MTATAHAIIGTVIAAKVGNPALAIPIAILSHLAADSFPHWDSGTNERKKTKRRITIEAVIDVCSGFAAMVLLIYFLFPQTSYIYAFIIVLFAQFFDWTTAPYYFWKWKFPPFTWSYNFGMKFDNRLDAPWGVINQILILVLLVVLAKNL